MLLLRRMILVSIVLVGAGGCGNAVDVQAGAGLAGVSVTTHGNLVINAYVCNDYVDVINIVRDRAGLKETEENPLVRNYRSATHLTGNDSASSRNVSAIPSPLRRTR